MTKTEKNAVIRIAIATAILKCRQQKLTQSIDMAFVIHKHLADMCTITIKKLL